MKLERTSLQCLAALLVTACGATVEVEDSGADAGVVDARPDSGVDEVPDSGPRDALDPAAELLERLSQLVAERIEQESGRPPQNLQVLLLGIEHHTYQETGLSDRVLVGASFRSLGINALGVGDLYSDPGVCTYQWSIVSDVSWRPWLSWSSTTAPAGRLSSYLEPFWAFGKADQLVAATLYPANWQQLFGLDPLVSYSEDLPPADLTCK
jgi:hypothetical protein